MRLFIEMMQYKAQNVGLNVILTEEYLTCCYSNCGMLCKWKKVFRE